MEICSRQLRHAGTATKRSPGACPALSVAWRASRSPRSAAALYRAAPAASRIAPPAAAAAAARAAPRRPRAAAVRVAASAVPTAEPGKTTLGFVGIGIMGLAMANNLLKAGYKVVVWNRSADKCDPLKAAGAEVASSAAEVASKAQITFAMLSDPEAAIAVAEDVAKGMGPGKGYVDVSTVDAATSQAIAAQIRAAGGAFLEAPVSGSKGPAEQGQLIFLAAGDRSLFDAAAAPLDVMGKRSFYLGEAGAGAHMKLVVNMVMGSMMAAFAEGLALTEQLGLSQSDLLEVISLGAIASPMFALKGPNMAKGAYPTAFPLKHQQKDLRLAIAAADAKGQPLAVAAAANDLYIRAKGLGQGDADFSAVLAAVAQQQAGAGRRQ